MSYDYDPVPVTPGYPQYQPIPAQPAKKKKGRYGTGAVLALVAIALLLGCGAGYIIGSVGSKANSATDRDAASGGGTSPEAKKDPNAISDDGVLVVGSDVLPGTYKTTVPANSQICYWARLKDTSGDIESIITNGNQKAGDKVTVTIAKTDKAFQTTGCGTWMKTA